MNKPVTAHPAASFEMIDVAAAKKIILENAGPLHPLTLPLQEAAGLILAEDIYSPIDIPFYDQSSMDGYALSFSGWQAGNPLNIQGEMAAGGNGDITLLPGHAVRIFTGAPVPRGADTVVMQEKTKVENNQLFIQDASLQPGLNVRRKGTEIRAGELALRQETLVRPASIGFLASLGITTAKVFPLPTVSIIVTGNELQSPGQPLMIGQVYETNSWSLKAALKQLQIENVKVYRAEDTMDVVERVLKDALEHSNIVFLTGGVSVGDYDFVAAAAERNGVHKLFHKIKQRPGKPFYFGKKESQLVFGLPGNPASVLTCFYEYAEPAIRQMMRQSSTIKIMQAPLATAFKKSTGLTHFLKGFYDGTTVLPLTAQESYRLSSFAEANCLIQVAENTTNCMAGELVEIHLLP